MNRNFEANDLRDSFASLSDKDIKKLRKQAQSNHMEPEELQTIAEEISEKLGRHIRLPANYPADMLQPDTLSKNLQPLILYKEIEESLKSSSSSSVPLLHQYKRSDALYRALYKWHKFTESTQPFIKPIHYSMLNAPIKRSTARSMLTLNNKDLCVAVQDRLVQSHHEPLSLLTPELIEPLEKVLDVSLIKVLIVRDVLFFFFEWSDPMPFVFAMVFNLYFTETVAEKFARHTIVTLHRKNIVDLEDDEQADEDLQEAEQLKKKKAAALAKKGGNVFIDIEEDDEEEPKEPTKYMNSEDIEQEHLLRPFIECIRQSPISYLTSVYIKRD